MGFALWIEGDLAWADGTYEYRPFGAAVISRTDLFRPADFRADRKPPVSAPPAFIGYFASLGEVNEYLRKSRKGGTTREPPVKLTLHLPESLYRRIKAAHARKGIKRMAAELRRILEEHYPPES